MKHLKISFLAVLTLLFTFACDDDAETVTVDSSQPTGTFTAQRSGMFTAQNSTPTAGMAAIGTDSDGETFLQFGSNFTTNLATGTVTVYFSTSSTLTLNASDNSSNQLVGIVTQNGMTNFKTGTVDSKFTHVILWCGSANVPFGYAELK